MARKPVVEISVAPHEVVIGPRRLTVSAPAALDPEVTRGAIGLATHTSAVALSRGGRQATVDIEGGLPPGPHTLTVGELVSTAGKRLAPETVIPFFVSDSRAPVPARLRVQSLTRLQVEPLGTVRVSAAARPAGAYIEVMKAVDRRTGRPVELAYDQRGKAIDAARVFDGIQKRRRAVFGKLHPTLKGHVDRAGASTRLPVAVWLRLPEATLPAKAERRATKTAPKAERARYARQAEIAASVAQAARDCGAREPRVDPRAPVVFAALTADGIRRLEAHPDVAGLFFYDRTGEVDLTDSMDIAQSDTVQSTLGLSGRGINVAVYEDGPDVTTNLSITARFLTNPNTDDHARHTHGIIKNIEANRPHGHAANCRLHSANSMDLDAVTWAAQTRGCTVISQSFHRSAEQTDSGLSFDDMFKDWVALQWPYPTIVHAAGNGTSSEFVNHKGFNTLTVGNHNDTATSLSSDSVFRNPASVHSDRELPELAANGMGVTCVGLTKSGTSMAAPAVAGSTALLQEADATLQSWPEGCRAILLAAASRNVTGSTWWTDRTAAVDGKDGSGALDALEGTRIARARRSRNAAGTRRGWDVGTLRSADFGAAGETTFSYQVTVPRFIFNARVKVALAWDSLAAVVATPFFTIAVDQLQVDYDLMVYDAQGTLVGYSGSWDNSYEIAEFNAQAGQTYTIKIRRWSGTADVWYGVAWTVQGTSLIRPDWELTTVARRPRRRTR